MLMSCHFQANPPTQFLSRRLQPLGRGAWIVAVAWGLGCGGNTAADARDPAPGVQGATPSDSRVTIEVPPMVRLVQGKAARVPVKLTRSGTPVPVEVSVSGLPPGVTASPLQVPVERSEGELVMDVSAASVQGTRAEVTVTAKAGDSSASAKLAVHVTGEPGSPDLSFGDRGMVTVNPPGLADTADVTVSALAVRGDGKVIVVYNHNVITLVDANGQLATEFGTGGRADPDNHLGYHCSPDFQPCLLVESDFKTTLLTPKGLFRLSALGELDLGFGNEGSVTWPDDVSLWRASPTIVDGQVHFIGAGVPQDVYSNVPKLLRFSPSGAPDPRFDTTDDFDCSNLGTKPASCLFPAAISIRPNGTVLYAGYLGTSGQAEVRLAEFSTKGEKLYTSPVLFASELIVGPQRRQFAVQALAGGSAAVVGLDLESRLTAATVSSTGTIETAARPIEIERSSTKCDNFGVFEDSSGLITLYCTHDAHTELRLLRFTAAFERDSSFGTGGLAIGDTRAAHAQVAPGLDDTIMVGAGRRLLRLWN